MLLVTREGDAYIVTPRVLLSRLPRKENCTIQDQMSFTRFKRLPAELRAYIWRLSLPEDESEVCVNWWEARGAPLLVDTGFPTAMHVCFKSRAIALASGIQFRDSAAAGCPVPYRPFDTALDILYWGLENCVSIFLTRSMDCLKDVQHVAVEAQRADAGLSSFFWNTFPLPRVLPDVSMVLPDAELLELPDAQLALMSYQRQNVWQPSSRYKLVLLDEDGPGATRISKALVSQRESESLVQSVMDGMHERLCIKQALRRDRQKCIQETGGGIQGTGEETQNLRPQRPGRVNKDMLMFVEYQKDGTWKECCADRAYMCEESKRRIRMMDELVARERLVMRRR